MTGFSTSSARASRRAAAAVVVLSALALSLADVSPAAHGGDDNHLPPVGKNVELVSKLEPLSQGAVGDDQIGDLAVFKGHAYLQSGANCAAGKGGFYSIDIGNPAAPRELAFVPALAATYHGAGAQAIALSTSAFAGDVLAVNNESCSSGLTSGGGFDLYNVSNPAAPIALRRGFGDFGGEGSLTGTGKANDAHSLSIWQHGAKAYVALVDNEELHDLDIFEITNPASPQPVREYNLQTLAPQAFSDFANVGERFLRDVSVKTIGGRPRLLVSYWDGGYIQLDASDPANLTYNADSDFGGSDPLTGFSPPEGNAHHAEYTFDNRMLVTAEEDAEPFRVTHIDIANVGRRGAAVVRGAAAPHDLQDGVMNGPTAYVGYGCDGSAPVPTPAQAGMPAKEPGEEWIAVVQRGPAFDPDEDYDGDDNTANDSDDACFPGDKARNAAAAGWEAVLIVNRHTPSGAAGDGVTCGSGGFSTQTVTVCTTHEAFHRMFNDPVEYTTPYDDSDLPATGDHALPAEGPNIGDPGAKVTVEGRFDGWGYMSLYSTTPDGNGKFPLLDAHAIKEALNPAYASGFGVLSSQEQAADPTEPLTFASWASGGLRVFSFEAAKITEQGAFIDQGGNDLSGVEPFTTSAGERLIAASDRDYGLYVLRYTGPLAPLRPTCSAATVAVPFKTTATVPVRCVDGNAHNVLTRSIAIPPAHGPLGAIDQQGQSVTYTHTGGAIGTDSFTFTANDGAASSAPAKIELRIVPRDGGACFNGFVGTSADDTIIGSAFGDRIASASGNDVVKAGAGADCASGAGGSDRLSGEAGSDRLSGGAGADRLDGGTGTDRFIGGTGNDLVIARDGIRERIDCGGGRDTVRADKKDTVLSNCESVSRTS